MQTPIKKRCNTHAHKITETKKNEETDLKCYLRMLIDNDLSTSPDRTGLTGHNVTYNFHARNETENVRSPNFQHASLSFLSFPVAVLRGDQGGLMSGPPLASTPNEADDTLYELGILRKTGIW